jgi:UDP-4-amino-4,6-dideoxy-N-acetyl-beta-L-altrosamine transaminase
MTPLPYGRQLIEDDDIAAVLAVLRSDFLAHGPQVTVFEQAFAAKVGAKEAVACSSGTAALHLALAGLGVGPGDLCVVPAITFLSTATAVLMCGAEVVFADVDPRSGLMMPETLAAALAGRRARAVLPVHLGGRLCDLAGLALVAGAAGAVLVEDAAHAVGGVDGFGQPVGACHTSEAACFSLHPVKTLAAGEGGMVTLNDPERAARLRRLRNHGVTHDPAMMTQPGSLDADGVRLPWIYEQVELGWNYRMDEMSAALGLSQLGKLERFVARRAKLAALYDEALTPLAPVVRTIPRGEGRPVLHLYQVRVDFDAAGISRAEVMRRMTTAGVATQVHYIPLYRQPVFKARYGEMRLPEAEAFYAKALALPLFPAMADNEVEQVAEVLASALGLN